MDLVLKRSWIGVLVFFCVAMVPSESGDSCIAKTKLKPETLMRMVQVTMIKGNILKIMVEKAMKNGDNHKMIKGIKGLTIQHISIPKTALIFKPDDKAIIVVAINITVAGKSFIGGNMAINVVGELEIDVHVSKSPDGKVIIKILGCKVTVKSCKTNLPSSMLPKIVNKFLDSTLGKVMPGVLCPAADMLMDKQMEAFEAMMGKKPLGTIGYIVYEVSEKPLVETTCININVRITIEKKNGEAVQSECDPLPDNLPPTKEKMSAIYLSAGALNAVMILVQPHLNIVLTKVKGSIPTSDQLKKILPKAGLPAGKKLKVQITHQENPKVTVSSSASYITTEIEASFLDVKRGNQILSITMKHQCSTTFAIKQEHLSISLKAGSCKTLEVSSPAGDVTGAMKYMETVMDSWISHGNGVLNKNQIPLPSIMNVTSTTNDPELNFVDPLMAGCQQGTKRKMADLTDCCSDGAMPLPSHPKP
ncbi:BPI fold-containing family B member 6-like [Ahaetulla prasina]|uniref:BPI fold-containing family B member 6-like n=1 Tax=Ahaetulla prasina TaxID=499056 RepID=UPI0026498B8A|nr:BPI fold-containing family B member 6-like [Ahaetulla prasina]